MATKLKVNYEFVGDSTTPVTRTDSIKHGNDMLNTVINTAVSTANGKADKTYVDTELGKKADKSEVNGKADASTVAALQTAVNGKAESATVSALSERVSTNETNIATQTSRIDNIVAIPPGSTEGNAELIDIRTGADGKSYPTAGDAVRGQITDVDSRLSESITDNLTHINHIGSFNIWDEVWELGYISSSTGENVNTEFITVRSKNLNPCESDTVYFFHSPKACTVYYYGDGGYKEYLGYANISANTAFRTHEKAHYLRIRINADYGTVYNNDVSINYPHTNTAYIKFDRMGYAKAILESKTMNESNTQHIEKNTSDIADNAQNIIKNASNIYAIGNTMRTANLFNANTANRGTYLYPDGRISNSSGYFTSDFIEVSDKVGKTILHSVNSVYEYPYSFRTLVFYGADKNTVVQAYEVAYSAVVPNGAVYMRVCGTIDRCDATMLSLSRIPFEPYYDTKNIKVEFDGLYVEPINIGENKEPRAYIKFNNVYIKRDGTLKQYAYSDIIRTNENPNGLWTTKSLANIPNCLYANKNNWLVYNDTTRTIEYVTPNQITTKHTILAGIGNGEVESNMIGVISEYYATYALRDFVTPRHRLINNTFDSYINSVVSKAVKLRDNDCFTFAYMSDVHSHPDRFGFPNLTSIYSNAIDRKFNFDAIVNCGDIMASGVMTHDQGYNSLMLALEPFDRKERLLAVRGNHDANGHTLGATEQKREWTVTGEQFYQVTQKYLENDPNVVFGSKENCYFYKDFPSSKVRVVVLNTNEDDAEFIKNESGEDILRVNSLVECGFRQPQIDWLVNSALDFSSKEDAHDWHTIILTHIPLEEMKDNTPRVVNDLVVRRILLNFRNGTSNRITYSDTQHGGFFDIDITFDFRSQGSMNLVGVFSGHNHLDRINKTPYNDVEGYNQVTIMPGYVDENAIASEASGGVVVNRDYLTPYEMCFDIVVVNTRTKSVDLIRCGGGIETNGVILDRHFDY